jgi:hypothetical protein
MTGDGWIPTAPGEQLTELSTLMPHSAMKLHPIELPLGATCLYSENRERSHDYAT